MSDEIDRTENEQADIVPGSAGQPDAQPAYSWAPPAAAAAPSGRSRSARLFGSVITAWIVAAALALAVVGLSVALAVGNSAPAGLRAPIVRPAPVAPGSVPTPVAPGSAGNRSPFGGSFATLGVAGTVTSVGSGTFTVTGVSGQLVTVDEQSSTTYDQGATSASSAAVVQGSRVLVLGSRSGTTVKATRVIVLPAGAFGGAGGFGGFAGPSSSG
jgi:hypothetical protein